MLIYSFIKDNSDDFLFPSFEGCGKTAVQQLIINQAICLNYTGGPLIERRRAKRFQVDWQIRVEGTQDGGSFIETGVLQNISSTGALLTLPMPLREGDKLDVFIKLPLQRKKWMKYPAHVVRVERGIAAVGTAIKFDRARPDFGMPFLPL